MCVCAYLFVGQPVLRTRNKRVMVELRHGRASSKGPRSVMEDLLIAIPDLTERVTRAKGTGEDQTELPEPSAYFGVSGRIDYLFIFSLLKKRMPN